jgi:ATP-binding cassette subfamily F protein 3
MLWLSGLEKGFGPQVLFEGVDWQVNPGQRVGLIGPNGAGKSTLMRIIAGELEADKGTVTTSKGLSLGYLPQELHELSDISVRDAARQGLEAVWAVQRELDRVAELLSHEPQSPSLLERYGALQAEFERVGGFEADARVEQVLCGLGFRADELDGDCGGLSGGWQMRVALARLLLRRPDVLLLDEPTNHLDLRSVDWLCHFLKGFSGALIIISHDRWFLNEICTHIAELSPEGLEVFVGDFEQYVAALDLRREQLERQRKAHARKVASLERFIERFKAKATKATQAQSRAKQLEKLQAVGEVREVETIHFKLPPPPKCGRVVLSLEDLHQGYSEDALIYRGLEVQVERGEHIALVGPNGAGKSTLLKLLAGAVHYQRGARVLGHLVKPYYFAQHQAEDLDLSKTVLDEAQSAYLGDSIAQLRGVLGAFLFDAEDIKKRVGVLSGGEKNRLALVKMLLTPANVLLLDEPTNHLDMGSREVLADALRAYPGAVVLISHDRHFIDAVCDQVWEVDRGRVTPFVGTYSEYLERVARGDRPSPFPLHGERALTTSRAPSDSALGAGATPISPDEARAGAKAERKLDRQRLQELRALKVKTLRPLKVAVESAEGLIQSLEERQKSLEAQQFDEAHYSDPQAVVRVAAELRAVQSSLEAAYATWEAATLALEEADARFAEDEP